MTISTDTLSEPFNTIGPVYAITTNIKGVLENAAKKLGIDVTSLTDSEFLSSFLLGESLVNIQAIPIAFAVCVEQLKQQAAKIGGDAVIGMRMNYDLERSGGGLHVFTMQLFGTAVRRRQPS